MVEWWEIPTALRKVEQKGYEKAEQMDRLKAFQMVESKVAKLVRRWVVLMARQMAARTELPLGGHLDEIEVVAKVVP